MDLLGGYESDSDGEAAAAAPSSAHPLPSASDVSATATDGRASPPAPSAAFLAEVAQATIAPDQSTTLPPGQLREAGIGVRAETEDEKRERKRAKKESKKEAKAAAAAPAKPKLVLPSAAALMSGVSLTAMGFGQSGNEADSEPSPPAASFAPRGPDGKPRYNALPPPASLIAGDQLSEADAWRMKPMDMEAVKKRKFSDFPTPTPAAAAAASSAAVASAASAAKPAAAARPAAASSSSSAGRLFAPPQVSRSRANVSTEDVG